MRLIEPDGIAGARVALNALAELPRAQAAVVLPLPLNAGAAAIGFDGGAVFGVEHLLPGQVEIAVITHIENARGKAFANRFGHVSIHRAGVGNRGLTAACGGRHAVKPDFHGPLAGVGLLAVQGNVLMGRILGRGVHPAAHRGARRGAKIVAEQRLPERGGKLAKGVDGGHLEAAQQHTADAGQGLLHRRL